MNPLASALESAVSGSFRKDLWFRRKVTTRSIEGDFRSRRGRRLGPREGYLANEQGGQSPARPGRHTGSQPFLCPCGPHDASYSFTCGCEGVCGARARCSLGLAGEDVAGKMPALPGPRHPIIGQSALFGRKFTVVLCQFLFRLEFLSGDGWI